MAFNGHQHFVGTIDDNQDGTATKQQRSDTEGPAYWTAEPDDEAVGPAGRALAAGQTSSSRARQRSDSAKKTRPRMSYILHEEKGCMHLLKTKTWRENKGLGVFDGNETSTSAKIITIIN